jgi:membrane fusion protein, heavy metal efflux system
MTGEVLGTINYIKMKKGIVFLIIILCIISCKSGNNNGSDSAKRLYGDTIKLPNNSAIISKIKTTIAVEEDFSPEFRTVGTVRAISGKIAKIAPPYPGRVTASTVRLGQKVRAGQTLVEYASSEFYEASKNYFQALRSSEMAQKNYERKRALFAGGIASQRELDEASLQAENAAKELQQAVADLKVYNMDASHLSMGESMKIPSPISGEIVQYNVTVGEYVKEEAEPLATIADLGKVWVEALIKERYIGVIHKGDKVEIYTDAKPGKVIWGKIYHIGDLVDEQTRSVPVLVECDNSERDLKPGMFTAVHFMNAPVKAIILPSSALFQSENSSYLFVKSGPGVFVRRNVDVESIKGGKSHLLGGLSTGEEIVVEGGLFLTEIQ